MNLDLYKSFLTGHEDAWIAPYDIQQEIIHIDEPIYDKNIKDVMQHLIERIEALNNNDIPKKFLVSISRVHIQYDGFGYLLELCQKYEKVCFQTKHGSYHELFKCAKDQDLSHLLDSQRIFVSTDLKSNLNERNLHHYLTMEKDRDYWRQMAEEYHTTVKGLHYHVLVSKMTDNIARNIGNACIKEYGKEVKEMMYQKEVFESVVRYYGRLEEENIKLYFPLAYKMFIAVSKKYPNPPVVLFQAMVERENFNIIKHEQSEMDWKIDSVYTMMRKIAGTYVNCYSMLSEDEKDLLSSMKSFLSNQ
eukprot:NODE_297_length_11469_cov_0.855937.p4 type:complete len:304 gc:universal NODE_297_length_11469_cov_0.855937:1298-387(-)